MDSATIARRCGQLTSPRCLSRSSLPCTPGATTDACNRFMGASCTYEANAFGDNLGWTAASHHSGNDERDRKRARLLGSAGGFESMRTATVAEKPQAASTLNTCVNWTSSSPFLKRTFPHANAVQTQACGATPLSAYQLPPRLAHNGVLPQQSGFHVVFPQSIYQLSGAAVNAHCSANGVAGCAAAKACCTLHPASLVSVFPQYDSSNRPLPFYPPTQHNHHHHHHHHYHHHHQQQQQQQLVMQCQTHHPKFCSLRQQQEILQHRYSQPLPRLGEGQAFGSSNHQLLATGCAWPAAHPLALGPEHLPAVTQPLSLAAPTLCAPPARVAMPPQGAIAPSTAGPSALSQPTSLLSLQVSWSQPSVRPGSSGYVPAPLLYAVPPPAAVANAANVPAANVPAANVANAAPAGLTLTLGPAVAAGTQAGTHQMLPRLSVSAPMTPPLTPDGDAPRECILMLCKTLCMSESTTARLALHIWNRIRGLVRLLVSVRQPAHGCSGQLGAGGLAATAARAERLYSVTALWVAAKLEERRREVPAVQTLAVAACTTPGVLVAAEVRVLQWCQWAPYAGFLPDDSHLLIDL